jgi:hypothetical protein
MIDQSNVFEKLMALLEKQDRFIPVSVDLWDVETIALYLKRNKQVVRDRITQLPDFPAAIRLPTAGSRGGNALYRAKEVIEWVEKYRDKNQAKRLASSSAVALK